MGRYVLPVSTVEYMAGLGNGAASAAQCRKVLILQLQAWETAGGIPGAALAIPGYYFAPRRQKRTGLPFGWDATTMARRLKEHRKREARRRERQLDIYGAECKRLRPLVLRNARILAQLPEGRDRKSLAEETERLKNELARARKVLEGLEGRKD